MAALGTVPAAAGSGGIPLKETFDTDPTANHDLYDVRGSTHRVENGSLVLVYPSAQTRAPVGIECQIPAVPKDPDERSIDLRFGPGGAESSNSLFIAYAVGPGEGLSLPPLPGGIMADTRNSYIIRMIRHGDGTNEIKFYRNDTGWTKELKNDWTLPANPITTLRRILIHHRRNGEHFVTATFDTGTPFEKTYAFEDATYVPGNAQRRFQITAKGHTAKLMLVEIATDTWIVRDSFLKGLSKVRQKDEGANASRSKRPINPTEETARAKILFDAGNTQSALEACLDILDQDPRFDDALNLLGLVEISMSNYADGHVHLQRALDIRIAKYGREHPKVAESLVHLAGIYRNKDLVMAENFYKVAGRSLQRSSGPHSQELARVLTDLAGLYASTGRPAEAEPLYRQTINIYEKHLGPDHPDMARHMANLGWLYVHRLSRTADAEPLYRKAIALYKKSSDTSDLELAQYLYVLSEILRTQSRHAKVEPILKQVLAIRQKATGPDHPEVGKIYIKLAETCRALNKFSRAEKFCAEGVRIYEKALGPEHPETAGARNNLANIYLEMGQYAKAERIYIRAVAILEKTMQDHPILASALENMAILYRRMDRPDEAAACEKKAKTIREKLVKD